MYSKHVCFTINKFILGPSYLIIFFPKLQLIPKIKYMIDYF